MAVISPLIRLLLLVSNVWFTFKATDLPRHNSRSKQLSSRLIQQRRRNLRSCLVVWFVWGLGLSLESISDNIFHIFPFYYEVKIVLWIFLLLGRTVVANPLLIHLIRPMVKPYISILDSTLELLRILGDLIIALTLWPIRTLRSMWSGYESSPITNNPLDVNQPTPSTDDIPAELSSKSSFEASSGTALTIPQHPVDGSSDNVGQVQVRQSRRRRSEKDVYRRVDSKSLHFEPDEMVPPLRISKRAPPRRDDSDRGHPHIDRHSARSSASLAATYSRPSLPTEDVNFTSRVSATRSVSQPSHIPSVTPNNSSLWDEAYPPFPSAYPPTPQVSQTMLLASRETEAFVEHEPYPPFPSAYPFTPPPADPPTLHPGIDSLRDFHERPGHLDINSMSKWSLGHIEENSAASSPREEDAVVLRAKPEINRPIRSQPIRRVAAASKKRAPGMPVVSAQIEKKSRTMKSAKEASASSGPSKKRSFSELSATGSTSTLAVPSRTGSNNGESNAEDSKEGKVNKKRKVIQNAEDLPIPTPSAEVTKRRGKEGITTNTRRQQEYVTAKRATTRTTAATSNSHHKTSDESHEQKSTRSLRARRLK